MHILYLIRFHQCHVFNNKLSLKVNVRVYWRSKSESVYKELSRSSVQAERMSRVSSCCLFTTILMAAVAGWERDWTTAAMGRVGTEGHRKIFGRGTDLRSCQSQGFLTQHAIVAATCSPKKINKVGFMSDTVSGAAAFVSCFSTTRKDTILV